jgi:NIPSNAP
MATLSWKGPTVLWLAGSVQITALIEHFERNNHANLAEIPRRERFYAETLLCFIFSLRGAAIMLGFSTLRGSYAESPYHVYELRLYNVNEGKMDALKARFGDHVDAIFRRHNMKSIGYWSPEDAPDSQNLLIYILEHPSRQEAEKNWAAFQADPEWQKVKAESEANGKLVDHIDHYFMDPTSFSALK